MNAASGGSRQWHVLCAGSAGKSQVVKSPHPVLTPSIARSPISHSQHPVIYILYASPMVWKTGLPVRSAVLKPHAGELVVGWVTTSESSL
ncbi:L-lysine 2-3-aminomutase, partial [Penicillium cf. viridicatum]